MNKSSNVFFINRFCEHFGIKIEKEDLIHVCNVFTMMNHFLYDIKGNDAELRSTQVKSYIVYSELSKMGYEISSKTYGESDWEGFLE